MSAPIFSTDPADYPLVSAVISGAQFTPVLVVIGGSHAINTTHLKSDFDVWGYYLEDEPEEFSVPRNVRLSVLGNGEWTQFILQSLAKARHESTTPINDPPRRIWIRENFLAQPRIYDSVHAEDFRKELLAVPALTVANYYIEGGDWYSTFDTEKMNTHAIRMYLTGTRLLALDELIIDYQILKTWAGDPSVAEAREKLQTEIDKL